MLSKVQINRLALSLLLIVSVNSSLAQNQYNLSDLAPGQLLLNFSASEELMVEQDTLIAILEYSTQGRDKTALQDEVNSAMSTAPGSHCISL